MYKLLILPSARDDIRESSQWYNQRQAGLGRRFAAEVREQVRSIRKNPQAAPIRYEDVRTAVLNIFPYMIHYTIDEAEKTVLIAGVFHTSISPERWKRE